MIRHRVQGLESGRKLVSISSSLRVALLGYVICRCIIEAWRACNINFPSRSKIKKNNIFSVY